MNVYGFYRIGGFEQDEFGLESYEEINIASGFGFPKNISKFFLKKEMIEHSAK